MKVTLELLTESIFDDIIYEIIRDETLNNVGNFKSFQNLVGKNDIKLLIDQHNPNCDIYNQDKQKLKTNDQLKYFSCENCGRNISGGRFAQHINKCLERKRK